MTGQKGVEDRGLLEAETLLDEVLVVTDIVGFGSRKRRGEAL